MSNCLIMQNVNLLMPEALSLAFKNQPPVHYCFPSLTDKSPVSLLLTYQG